MGGTILATVKIKAPHKAVKLQAEIYILQNYIKYNANMCSCENIWGLRETQKPSLYTS